jgi:MoaA/NifB/PqqE/SkfB family radical SAM enzyme
MCQRWKDTREPLLTLEDYRKLADDFSILKGVHQISIAGGEPLMRQDAFPILGAFSSLGMSVNLCTNGMLIERYLTEIEAAEPTCVTVSLDGATAQTHDRIRGKRGSYQQIEKGIRAFLKHRRKKLPILRVRMTISGQNQNEIRQFHHRWRNVADDVLLQPVHLCHDSYYTGLNQTGYQIDPEVISEQISGTPFEKDGYMKEMIRSLRRTGKYPHQRCYAGVLMVRIDPYGNIYPCLEQHVAVGSLKTSDFQSIWYSQILAQERKKLTENQPCNCWYNNTALIGYYGDWLRKFNFMPLKKTTSIPSFENP